MGCNNGECCLSEVRNWDSKILKLTSPQDGSKTHVESVHTAVDYSQQPRRNLFTRLKRPRHAGTAGSHNAVDNVRGGQRRHELRHRVVLEARTSERHEDDRNVSQERRQGHKDGTECQRDRRYDKGIV